MASFKSTAMARRCTFLLPLDYSHACQRRLFFTIFFLLASSSFFVFDVCRRVGLTGSAWDGGRLSHRLPGWSAKKGSGNPSRRCTSTPERWDEMERSHKEIRQERLLYWQGLSHNYIHNVRAYSSWTSEMIHSMLPTYTCPVHRRYGGIPDGGKTMCDPKCTLTRPSCLVYSFGVASNCEFEHKLWAEHANCEIHLFDPTPSVKNNFRGRNICHRPADDTRMHFHPWGLGGYMTSAVLEGRHVELSPLSDIMRRLGHEGRILDVLKMDVEGSEYDAFKYLFDKSELPAIHLLLLEGHMGRPNPTLVMQFMDLMKKLDEAAFRLYHLERNPYGCWADFEAAFLNKTMLPLAYT